jgi:hypothetical protein
MRLILLRCAALLLSCSCSAHAASIVRCPDGTFREAPCPVKGASQGAPSSVSPSGLSCDPLAPGYAECRQAMNGLAAQRNREARSEEQRQQSEASAKRSGEAWQKLTRNCDHLHGAVQRSECQRKQSNERIHGQHQRQHDEQERQARLEAQRRANWENAQAQQRKHDAATAATLRRLQAQQN